MMPERWHQIEDICHRALALPPSERAAFVAGACAGDDGLRHEVESLIASHERSGEFIDFGRN